MIYVHTYIFMFGKVNPDNKDQKDSNKHSKIIIYLMYGYF